MRSFHVPFFTHFEILRDAIDTAKAQIRQGDGLALQFLHFIIESLAVSIHSQPLPTDHTPQFVENPAQFDANRPTSLVFVLLTHLLFTVPLSNTVKKLGAAKKRSHQS